MRIPFPLWSSLPSHAPSLCRGRAHVLLLVLGHLLGWYVLLCVHEQDVPQFVPSVRLALDNVHHNIWNFGLFIGQKIFFFLMHTQTQEYRRN